jgi:hypothetical protein
MALRVPSPVPVMPALAALHREERDRLNGIFAVIDG